MNRITILLLAAALCLCLSACSKEPEPKPNPQIIQTEATVAGQGAEEWHSESSSPTHSEDAAEKTAGPVQQPIELVGPWHLDGEKNDLAAFSDCFPGYAEWGASMEIRSDGLMSWYIGAEGWHGTCEVDEECLHAELTSDLEQTTCSWNFRIVTENDAIMLEMEHADLTIYWAYGDQVEYANGSDNA